VHELQEEAPALAKVPAEHWVQLAVEVELLK
jgi:hypothetical protein